MSGLNLSTFDGLLKQHYTSDRVEDMVYKMNPWLALIPKMEDFGGRNLPIPIIYGNPQGRSKTFSNALARGQVTSSQITDFVLTRVRDYSIATIDNETMKASKGNEDAFLEAAVTEIDGAINSLTRSLAIGAYRGVDANIGQVLATPSNNAGTFQITLTQTSDITNFEINQDLVIWSATSGGSQRTSDGTQNDFVVSAVDRINGIITLTGTYSGSGTVAANDYLFVNGDRGLGVSGLADWIPSTTPTSTLFFGVNRASDPTRLGGLRISGAGVPIEEVITDADALVSREGGYIDHMFMNPKKVGELKKALGTKVRYVDLKVNPRISFQSVEIDGDRGPIKVIADQNCPYIYGYGVAMEYWKFYSLGKLCAVVDSDGLEMLRQATQDGVEYRSAFYGNIGCRAPGSNIVISF